jgi:hypothetical protein
MLVLGLLFSFVHAQEPSRDINKDEAKNARSQQKGKSAKKDKANRTDLPDGVSSDYEQKHTNVKNVTGSEKGGSATTGKLGPGGSSARLGSDTAAPKSGKRAKKGFLGRLFSRSSKSKSAKATGKAAGESKAAGASKAAGERPQDTETDHRDKP